MRSVFRGPGFTMLGVLFLFNVFCLADRQVLGALIEPLKADLGISDTQIGLLVGLAFAVVYSTCGIPISRLADHASRRTLIGVAFLFWSTMTMLCGLAGGFGHLLLARFGVALGEAGFGPSAQALIAEETPAERRTRAMSVFALGSTIGVVAGLSLGGWIASTHGWRAAFLVLGGLGVLAAPLAFLLPRQAPRDRASATTFRDGLKTLTGTGIYWPLIFAAAAHLFVSYAMTWNPAFLMRTHGLSVMEAGLWSGLITGVCGGAGTLLGGWLGDRLATKRPYMLPVLCGASVLVAVPFALTMYLAQSLTVSLTSTAIVLVLNSIYQAPTYAAVQLLAGDRFRATAAALMIFCQNLIGMGLGPLMVGALSDYLRPDLGDKALRWALAATCCVNLVSGGLYLFAARRMARRFVPKTPNV